MFLVIFGCYGILNTLTVYSVCYMEFNFYVCKDIRIYYYINRVIS